MKTALLAPIATRVPPALLRRLEELRHRRARRLGRRVKFQELVAEAIERLCADEKSAA